MPTYEYECKNCTKSFDVFQSMQDKVLTVCPHCEGQLRRVIHGGSGVIFKGSGFYKNDNPKQGKVEAKPAETSSANANSSTKENKKSENNAPAQTASTEKKSDTKEANTVKGTS